MAQGSTGDRSWRIVTRYRAFVIPVVGLIIVLGGFLVFNLRDDLIYYQTPAEASSAVLSSASGAFALEAKSCQARLRPRARR